MPLRPRPAAALTLAAIALTATAACSSAPPTPTQAAASLLSKAGAKPTSAAYLVGYDDGSDSNECTTGAAEADGESADHSEYVSVCVFPGNSQLVSYVSAGDHYGANAALIQVGTADLIVVEPVAGDGSPPAAVVQSIAGKTGGAVYH